LNSYPQTSVPIRRPEWTMTRLAHKMAQTALTPQKNLFQSVGSRLIMSSLYPVKSQAMSKKSMLATAINHAACIMVIKSLHYEYNTAL
jgi:hypothetical protein